LEDARVRLCGFFCLAVEPEADTDLRAFHHGFLRASPGLARVSGDYVSEIFTPMGVRSPSGVQTDQRVGRRANRILHSPGKQPRRRQQWLSRMRGQDLPPSRSCARSDQAEPEL